MQVVFFFFFFLIGLNFLSFIIGNFYCWVNFIANFCCWINFFGLVHIFFRFNLLIFYGL